MKNRKDFGQRDVLENLSVKRLILTIVYGILLAPCILLAAMLQNTYTRGFAMVFFIVFVVLFVRSLKKLLTDRLQDAIDTWFENVMRWVFHPLALLFGKVAKWLGIGRWRGWCEDEKTFMWKEREKGGRRKRLRNDQKWADQTDNRHRVRYLFIEYMIKRIRTGFLYRRQMTPDEMAEEMVLENAEKLLFDTYNLARYAKDAEISDEVVKTLSKVTAKR